jgi:hypothetical protein
MKRAEIAGLFCAGACGAWALVEPAVGFGSGVEGRGFGFLGVLFPVEPVDVPVAVFGTGTLGALGEGRWGADEEDGAKQNAQWSLHGLPSDWSL